MVSCRPFARQSRKPGALDGGERGVPEFTTAQLKTIQEVITLTVFSVFSVLYLREPLKWNDLVSCAMMVGAVAVIFKKW
jgi:uncharacterized protein (DUF486 family)